VVEGGGAILMASHDGELVGTCALIRHSGTVIELAKMAVDEAHQGRGIGRELCLRALDRARRLGATTVFLLTSPRLAAAIHLYRTVGFTETETAPVEHPGFRRRSIVMQLEIGRSDESHSIDTISTTNTASPTRKEAS
jgi:N-acetylglutamate synthase-like GNAT family acetyltransferase